ncbi:MAG: DUF5711 family protein [Lachnospiraceae bacterium]|nr:DUF5711 family protein [Lachnospiraceae bacterium]
MEYQEQQFKYNLKKLYITFLVIILIAAVALLIKIQIDNQVYTRCEIRDRLEKVGSANSEFADYNGNLLCYSMDGISAYDKNGNQLWNQTFQMQNVMVKTAGDYVVCADYQGKNLYLIGKKGLVKMIETNLPILSIDVSFQGIAIAQLQDEDKVYMEMYASDGSVITTYRTTMRNFGYPLAYAISADNIKVAVSYLKAIGGQISTSLAFYNFGGVGQNETDNLVSAFECEDEVLPFVTFPKEDIALAVGNHKIRLFEGKQKPALVKELEQSQEIHALYHNENYFAIILNSSRGAGSYDAVVYDLKGNEKITAPIDFDYNDVIVEDNRLIAYNQTDMTIVGYNGVVKYNGELSGGVRQIIPMDAYSKFLFVYEDKLEKIRLR